MKNIAAYLVDKRKLEFREIPIPKPKPNEVLVQIEYVGICGSDIHYYADRQNGYRILTENHILGHEPAGTVIEIGNDVKHLKVGDKVTIEPGVPCGKCEYCRSGNYNLCHQVQFLGSAFPKVDGAFRNYIVHDAGFCYKLPKNVSTKQGALIEPLGIGIEATNVGKVKLGDTVAIFGAGCIGLVTALACKARGASNIIVIDVINNRLQKALEIGANHVLNSKDVNVKNEIMKFTNQRGVDVVIDCAGFQESINTGVELIKRGGRIVMVGLGTLQPMTFDFVKFAANVGQMLSIFRSKNAYPIAINALQNKQIDLSKIITHEYDFKNLPEAFETTINKKDEVTKIVIRM
ncbi:MAG: NAD(P)-dependent alcohol dehydrogenase [Mycoplasmataceae bacterium]|jgi:L-iditol 2-dehydrogenase|nr:NAD(P)-dependent alcohol dehydrogenase [Mycoplasmataceae bacterium]